MSAQMNLDMIGNDETEASSQKEAMSISKPNNQHEILEQLLSALVAMQQILQSSMS